jgi:hypothetical protein
MRDAGLDRLTPCVEQFRDEHRRGICRRINVIGGAEELVGRVVVDHQHLAAGVGELTERAKAVDAGDVDGHDQVGVATNFVRADQQVATGQRLQ